MSSSARSSQNTIVRVSTATGSAKTITAITAANPPVVTSTAHGLSNGTVVVIASVEGMVEVNDRAFVIANVATDSFELKGVDGTGYTAYTSGGTATPQTMTEVANCRSVNLVNGSAQKIDRTNLRSRVEENSVGLAVAGDSSIQLDLDETDPGQTKLRNLFGVDTAVAVTVAMGNGAIFAQMVKVASFPANASVNGLWQGEVQLYGSTERAWFA